MLYQKYIKRILDIVLSLIAIIVLSPVLIILYFLIRTKLGSPVIFKQVRPGKNEKLFTMYKFRSMTDEKDDNGELLPDDERLTSFGRKLRSTSLDELPELFNILKGDMSIIGPRPLLVEYLDYYTEFEKQRHLVRPGLSGLAQINGRNSTFWDERLKLDVEYVNNVSFCLDAKILFVTVYKTIRRSDILVGKEIPAGQLNDSRSKNGSKN